MNIIDERLQRKLEILADAAKYDASCASSGAGGRNSRDGRGLGSTTGAGADVPAARAPASAPTRLGYPGFFTRQPATTASPLDQDR